MPTILELVLCHELLRDLNHAVQAFRGLWDPHSIVSVFDGEPPSLALLEVDGYEIVAGHCDVLMMWAGEWREWEWEQRARSREGEAAEPFQTALLQAVRFTVQARARAVQVGQQTGTERCGRC